MNQHIALSLFVTIIAGCSVAGCSDDGGSDPGTSIGTIELAGEWATEAGGFAGTATISNTEWKDYASIIVVSFDNEKNFAITRNPPDAKDIKPNLYSKTVWTEPSGGVTHVCIVDYDLATKEAALATTKTGDASDLAKGCGGFAWTKFTKK